jgi:hypothetical protein
VRPIPSKFKRGLPIPVPQSSQLFVRPHDESLSLAVCVNNPDCSPLRMAIKERSARNSESEVNSNRSVNLGRQGRLDYVNFGTYVPRI